MYVRWLGAFRKNGSLEESISYELSRTTDVACEKLQSGKSLVSQARIGLLVNPHSVYARFKGDVWSEYEADGKLIAMRCDYQAASRHYEAWAKPDFTGIVLKNGSLENFSKYTRDIVVGSGLPVYKLVKGKLVRIA